MKLDTALHGLTLLTYLGAALAYHWHLFAGAARGRTVALVLVPIGLLLHTGAIGAWCMVHTGILTDPAMPYSLAAYFVVLGQMIANLRERWSGIGVVVLPLAFLALSYAGVQTDAAGGEAAGATAWMRSHVLVLLLGFCAFALSFGMALMSLVQSRLLKSKHVTGVFSRLPPMAAISTGAHRMALVGFLFLTLGVISGALAAPVVMGPQWYLSPRVLPGLITSLVAWVIYAAYIAVSLGLGWRGRRTSYFLIAGFAVVLIAYFASIGRHKGTVATGKQGAATPASVLVQRP